MAAACAAASITEITFFGTCPTTWDNLTSTQKESCIGCQLIRKIEGHFAWAAAGQLLEQWNSSGEEEYSAVIAHRRAGRFRSLRRYKIPGHELRLLSLLPEKETAAPFVVITYKDKDDKGARDTIERLKQNHRLARFAFQYMMRQGNTRLTMGSPTDESSTQLGLKSRAKATLHGDPGSDDASVPSNAVKETKDSSSQSVKSQEIRECPKNLCGARIAIYTHASRTSSQKPQVSTIAGVLHIGDRYYALTVAHVFFDAVDNSQSWADSGLSLTSESSMSIRPEIPIPRYSDIYQVVVESLWPHDEHVQDESEIQPNSIGLVAPSLPHRRKNSATAALPEVIWDSELDWALIELRDPILCKPNLLTISDRGGLSLNFPPLDIQPPKGEVLIVAGVSGELHGHGLGTVGGMLLPWSSRETKMWSVESEIAVGDSGSFAICPQTGMVYGLVVAHDSDTLITFIVPFSTVFESILQRFELASSSMSTLFFIQSGNAMQWDTTVETELDKREEVIFGTIPYEEQPVYHLFSSQLKHFTSRNASGQPYVHTSLLIDWLLSKDNSQTTYLNLLLDSAYSKCIIVPVEARQLSDSGKPSLLVFSLLLELGRGDLIHLFLRNGLTDRKLPFPMTSLKTVIPSGDHSDVVDLPTRIFEKQWAFCPLTFDLEMALDLSSSTVIPIQQKKQINSKGGTASIWEILIPEEFVGDSLRQVAASAKFNSASDKAAPVYRFVLKTFDPSCESFYEKERDAFRVLQSNSQMIRCLGDYTYDKTCNLLLEYGEADLDEFFAASVPPTLASDIIMFWEDLFKIAEAVRALHDLKVDRVGLKREYHGWHADIKPDNILRVNGNFKLADFGFASFKWKSEERTLLRGGTTSYSAPEIFQQDFKRPDTNTRVTQAIDIWSFGCVLSIAACWVVLGEHGIQEFGNVRERAHRTVSNELWTSRQFHDGTHVLKEVREWHRYLRNVSRRTDVITENVLGLIDEHMLLAAPEQRYTASTVCDEFRNIVVRAKRHTESALSDTMALSKRLDGIGTQPTTLPKTPRSSSGSRLAITRRDESNPSFDALDVPRTGSIPPEIPVNSPDQESAGETATEALVHDPAKRPEEIRAEYGVLVKQGVIQGAEKKKMDREQPSWDGERTETDFLPLKSASSPETNVQFLTESCLGRGSSGVVWKVREKSTSNVYVRKHIPLNPSKQRVEEIDGVVRMEIAVMQKLRHLHIASILFSQKEDKGYNIFMLPVADYDLSRFLQMCADEDFPPKMTRTIYPWFGCLLDALAYAHRLHINHHDIKPSNILLKHSQPYLCDFGLATKFDNEDATNENMTDPSDLYHAPEIQSGRPHGRANDVFALGCIYTEMLTVCYSKSVKEYTEARLEGGSAIFRNSLDTVRQWVGEFEERKNGRLHELLVDVILDMIKRDPKDRIPARQAKNHLIHEPALFCVE